MNSILDGRRLPLNTRQRIQFNGSLIIDPVDRSSSSDAGTYTCEARGQSNNLARQSLQLSIMGKVLGIDNNKPRRRLMGSISTKDG